MDCVNPNWQTAFIPSGSTIWCLWRKLAGILIEAENSGGEGAYVIGIGVNLGTSPMVQDGGRASSSLMEVARGSRGRLKSQVQEVNKKTRLILCCWPIWYGVNSSRTCAVRQRLLVRTTKSI